MMTSVFSFQFSVLSFQFPVLSLWILVSNDRFSDFSFRFCLLVSKQIPRFARNDNQRDSFSTLLGLFLFGEEAAEIA